MKTSTWGLSLVVVCEGYSWLSCVGSSMQWVFLLWSTGSMCPHFSSFSAGALVAAHGLLRRDRLPIPVFWASHCGSADKESTCNVGDLGSIPGWRRSPGEGNGYPRQYSGLENSMDCIAHGVPKSPEGALTLPCISGNTRRFHTQLNKGPETP